MMWGSLTTDMFACYAHLSNLSIDDALLEQAGIKRPEKDVKADVLAPRQCPVCHLINGPTSRFCGQCGMSLTEEAEKEEKNLLQDIRRHPLYQQIYDQIKKDLKD
jgi:hypothetical protein